MSDSIDPEDVPADESNISPDDAPSGGESFTGARDAGHDRREAADAGADDRGDRSEGGRPGFFTRVQTIGGLTIILSLLFILAAIVLNGIMNLDVVKDFFHGSGLVWVIRIAIAIMIITIVAYLVLQERHQLHHYMEMVLIKEEANLRLKLLLEAGREMGSTLELESILDRMLHYTFAATGADLGAVYLWDKAAGALKMALVKGTSEQKMMFKEFPLEKGMVGEAASTRELIAVDDVSSIDERDNVFFGAAIPGSQLVVPLVARGKFVGVLVTATNERHVYTQDEKRMLEGFAELASLAISNAELYRIARASLDVAARRRGLAQSVLDEMVAGVMTCDRNGRIAIFNTEAARMTGYAFTERTQVLLRPERSIDENPFGPLEHGMLEVLENPVAREGDAVIMKKDKTLLPVSFRIYPLLDGENVMGAAAVFMEKGEEREEEGREGVDYQVLLRSLGARVERLYTHPLSRVLDRVRHMDIDQWSHSRDDIASILEAGSAALLSLLEDVEQYLNCVAVREWDSRDEHDLRTVTGDVVRDILESGDHDGVVVMVKLDGLPGAFGYRRMIRAAIEEVVENAVVAADEGGKRVEITGRRVDGRVRMEIRDNGPGLSVETREFMYLPFFTAREGSSGLGLSIANRVMRKIGGRMGAQDTEEGALFFLEFPVAPGPAGPKDGGAVGAGERRADEDEG